MTRMRRREFIKLIGSTAFALPMAARAQRPEQVRRIGVLLPSDDRINSIQVLLPVFKQHLYDLGWVEDHNINFECRCADPTDERFRTEAAELIALAPDIVVAWSNPAVAALRQTTQTTSIVFASVYESVESGLVSNLAHPGGNITGIQGNFEPAIGGRWLQLLKEVAPSVRRVAFVHTENIATNYLFMRTAGTASASLGVTLEPVELHEIAEIDPVLSAFAREPNCGLIVAPNSFNTSNDRVIIASAARLRLPAIYPLRSFAAKGGLVSYGFDTIEQQRGAAAYVDLILRGAKPGELPIQLAANHQLVVNLKTAKTLGLDVPSGLRRHVDEVIE